MKKLLTRQDLLDAGYTYHNNEYPFRHTNHLYQKAIQDKGGIKYHLNFWEYREKDCPQAGRGDTLEAEAQMFPKKAGFVNIIRSGITTESVKELERYYASFWDKDTYNYARPRGES